MIGFCDHGTGEGNGFDSLPVTKYVGDAAAGVVIADLGDGQLASSPPLYCDVAQNTLRRILDHQPNGKEAGGPHPLRRPDLGDSHPPRQSTTKAGSAAYHRSARVGAGRISPVPSRSRPPSRSGTPEVKNAPMSRIQASSLDRSVVSSALLLGSCGCGSNTGSESGATAGRRGGSAPTAFDARLLPCAAQAVGATRLINQDPVFKFEFVGDETLTYVIDTGHPDVLGGLLRVVEESTGVTAVSEAGMTYRDSTGELRQPDWLRQQASPHLTVSTSGDTLRLLYDDAIDGGHRRIVELRMMGKALQVHAFDPDGETNGMAGYAGFAFGLTESAGAPFDLRIPGMISTPVTLFKSSQGETAYVTVQFDWSLSNSGTHTVPTYSDVRSGPDWIDNSVDVHYPTNTDGRINAPVDETAWIVVTRNFEDTFPETEAEPSPYRDLLIDRTVTLFSRKHVTWQNKLELLRLFRDWGMDGMAFYDFYWWSASTFGPGPGQPQSHTWFPALDEANFLTLTAFATEAGFLQGYYTLYGINATQPFHDPTDAVVTDGNGSQARRIAPRRAISHSQRDESAMRAAYDTSMSYPDVFGHQHPFVVVDYDAAVPDKGKTTAEVLVDKRRLLRQMQVLHDGPCLSEGSGALHRFNRQYELLSAGFVDSSQATINTGAQVDNQDLAIGDPLTPVEWWVIPDYSLRVLNRTSVPHGNGFYDRFFVTSPTPIAENLLDRYRLYEITYGHTSFFQTTAAVNGAQPGELNNRLWYADMVKEYYMLQALQAEYFDSPVASVLYEYNSNMVDAGTVLASSTHPGGPLEEFRHPRIRIEYEGGLVIHLNHGPADWTGIAAGGSLYTLPEDGWVAHNSSTGLLAFSAIPTDPAVSPQGSRIDYALAPNRYEMLDGRGVVPTFGGFDDPAQGLTLQVRNLVRNILVVEQPDRTLQATAGPAPALVSLRLEGPTLMRGGHEGLLKAVATYDNGSSQRISHLLGSWVSSDLSVATVSRSGVINALAAGTTRISFEADNVQSGAFDLTVD